MDIEIIKLLVEIFILPAIAFVSAVIVAVFGGWVNYQFGKSLEKDKLSLASQPNQTQSSPEKTKDINDASDEWLLKVFVRGTLTLVNLAVWIVGALSSFLVIRPFAITFILRRINELQQIPPVQQMMLEVAQFIPMGIWPDLYLAVLAICIGFVAVAFAEAVEGTFFWIFDIKSLVS